MQDIWHYLAIHRQASIALKRVLTYIKLFFSPGLLAAGCDPGGSKEGARTRQFSKFFVLSRSHFKVSVLSKSQFSAFVHSRSLK